MRGSRGGGGGAGGLDPLPTEKITKNIGFLSKTGPTSLKNHKAIKQHSILGHYRHANDGRPMMAHLEWHLNPLIN